MLVWVSDDEAVEPNIRDVSEFGDGSAGDAARAHVKVTIAFTNARVLIAHIRECFKALERVPEPDNTRDFEFEAEVTVDGLNDPHWVKSEAEPTKAAETRKPFFQAGTLKLSMVATGYDMDEIEGLAEKSPEGAKEILRSLLCDTVVVSEGAFARYPRLGKLWRELREENKTHE
ncbi:MAG: hypothetical protein ACREJC_09995 [Tepidisphaeraceae bacterium]